VRSSDGVKRVKVIADMKMVPDPWRVQAQKYLPLVDQYGQKYQVDQRLILAVIETESSFNPKAKSHIPAYGLMQIVPKYAGRDAYRYIYKKDKRPSPRFLYQPKNNIAFGTAYLRILKEDYFYELESPEIQEYMVIAAYNGGMGLVIKRVLKKYNISQMSPDQVFQVLIREMPDETKGYLRKVTARKDKYRALMKTGG
jgi:membrane-bound lytic murein transglycosylase C